MLRSEVRSEPPDLVVERFTAQPGVLPRLAVVDRGVAPAEAPPQPLAVGTLLAHRLQQDEERAVWGEAWQETGLVFTREDGSMLHPEYVTRHFQRLAQAAGLRVVRLHDLRHGQASLMLAAGVPLALVSKRLGHSSYTLTADTYSHMLQGVGRDAANSAASLVPRKIPSNP